MESMTPKHTPGPWILDHIDNVRSQDSALVAKVATHFNIADPEGEANARLIAAAPDMLAVLQQLVAAWDDVAPNEDWPHTSLRDAAESARKVIAKATGEK